MFISKMARRSIASLLCIVLCVSMCLSAFAADSTTVRLQLNTEELETSTSEQEVTMNIVTTEEVSIDSLMYTIEVPNGWNVTQPIMPTGVSGATWANNQLIWYSTSTDVTGLTNLGTVNITVPANTIAGNYNISVTGFDASTNAAYWVEQASYSTTLTITGENAGGGEDPVIPTDKYYTADLSASSSTNVKVGDEVTVDILVGGTTREFASSELYLDYNGLTYKGATANGADITAANGKVKIIDHGDTTDWTEGGNVKAYSLQFTVDEIQGTSGTASVTLNNAAFSTQENAVGSNLSPATVTVKTKTFSVTPADLTVTVPGELTANGQDMTNKVVYGEDFEFEAADKYYDYTLSAEDANGNTVTITDVSDGKWRIDNVTSNVTITVTAKNPKKFDVSIDTTENFDPIPTYGEDAATYMTDYTFTLKENEPVNSQTGASGWTYEIDEITIGGKDYTANSIGRAYTIAGKDITGDIVITTKKTEVKADEYTITVNRNDVSNNELTVSPSDKVANDGSITLTLNPVAGYTYTVTYQFGNGQVQNVTWTDGANGVKTATITNLTGNVTITASKVVDASGIDVTVSGEYLALNGKTMYLVQVTSKLDSGYVYTYGNEEMYYSNEYNNSNGAYVYLVITDAGSPLTTEDAKTEISVAQGSVAGTINYGGDVNMTGRIDANDAQLVWNMYNAKDNQDNTYSNFDTVSMEKFLYADVDKNGKVDTQDAGEIVIKVKNRQ